MVAVRNCPMLSRVQAVAAAAEYLPVEDPKEERERVTAAVVPLAYLALEELVEGSQLEEGSQLAEESRLEAENQIEENQLEEEKQAAAD